MWTAGGLDLADLSVPEKNCGTSTGFAAVIVDVAERSVKVAQDFECLKSPDYAQIAAFEALDVILEKEGH